VISKAATLEGVEELTSADINGLVDRFAAWLMTNSDRGRLCDND